MRYLLFISLLIVFNQAFAQITVAEAAAIQPKEAYENLKVIPVYSDANSSMFVVFVKKNVRNQLHEYHTEIVTVLEGTGELTLGGTKMLIKKGDHVVIPPGVAHAVKVTSSKPLKVISIQSPEFKGKDRIFLKEEVAETKKENPKKNTEEEDTEAIPEYE